MRSKWSNLCNIPHPLGLDAGAGFDVGGGHVLCVHEWGDLLPGPAHARRARFFSAFFSRRHFFHATTIDCSTSLSRYSSALIVASSEEGGGKAGCYKASDKGTHW